MKLSPSDASALLSESATTPMHTGVLCVFDLPKAAGSNYLLQRYESLKGIQKLREPFNLTIKPPRLPVDLPGWTEVDPSGFAYQVRHLALPWPGSDKQLGELVSQLHTAPLNQSRPLWECVLIEGLENSRFAVYLKTHQALLEMSDVIGQVNRWMSSAPGRKHQPLPWALPAPKDPAGNSSGPVARLFSAYGQALEQVKTVPGLTRVLTRLATQALKKNPQATLPYSAPNSMLNADVTAQRRILMCSFPREDLMRVAKQRKASVTELILALAGGGLRHYLQGQKALPAKPLIARTEIKIPPRAEKGAKAGTVLFPVLVNLATHESKAARRIKAVRQSVQDSSLRFSNMSAAGMQRYANLLMWPYHLTKLAGVSGRVRPMFNLVVAEYDRQTRSLYAGDAPLVAEYPIPTLADGHALHIGYRVYVDSVDICITACPDRLPGAEGVLAGMVEELRVLRSRSQQ